MGFWKKLFGGADGCREAMRESYDKHVRLAAQGRIPTEDSPHVIGLYGTLGSRYRARGTPVVEVVLWGELAPFLAMGEADAVEALAEYVVFQESPKDARIEWLKDMINSALKAPKDKSLTAMAAAGLINQVAWCSLLEADTLNAVETEVEGLQRE